MLTGAALTAACGAGHETTPTPSPTKLDCAYDASIRANNPNCPIVKPTPNEVTPTPTPTPDSKVIAEQLQARAAAVQARLTAVSAAKMNEFVSILSTSPDAYTDSRLKNVRRLVVRGEGGVVYTDEVAFQNALGSPNNIVTAVGVYIRKPGEASAQHVIYDENERYESIDHVPTDPTANQYDGKVDLAYGYADISQEERDAADATYGILLGGPATDLKIYEKSVTQAQADFATAVAITDARY